MDNVIIKVKGLTKVYGNNVALDQLDLSVLRGEIFGVVGPNGAGKSTLLSLLATVIKPTSGEFHVAGFSSNGNINQIKRIIGYVPQDISLYTMLSGLDNLKFWAGLYNIRGRERDRKIDELVELTNLGSRIKDKVETYSGGMKRRLNIATALIHDPPVLLMDEPTAGMDAGSRNILIRTLKELKRKGRTIVFSSHYMDELEDSCDRALILEGGKAKAIGGLQEVKGIYTRLISDIYV